MFGSGLLWLAQPANNATSSAEILRDIRKPPSSSAARHAPRPRSASCNIAGCGASSTRDRASGAARTVYDPVVGAPWILVVAVLAGGCDLVFSVPHGPDAPTIATGCPE